MALALVCAFPASGDASGGCAPAGAKVLERSGGSSIYSVASSLYGCLHHERTLLGSLSHRQGDSPTRVTRYVLASPYVGVLTVFNSSNHPPADVAMYLLSEGQDPPVADAGNGAAQLAQVDAVVVSRYGVLAWSSRLATTAGPPRYELDAATAEYGNTVATAAVPFAGVHFSGIVLHWRSGPNGPLQTRAF